MFRTPVQEGTIHCPNCNFLINIVQNQTDGATYAKHWTAREISKTHWRFILALLNGSLDFYCENKTKKEIIEHYSSSFGQSCVKLIFTDITLEKFVTLFLYVVIKSFDLELVMK